MKRLILCVDDFGLKPEINEAVAELVEAGLVSATGCLSQGPAWRKGVPLLQGALRSRLDVGLHFNLTEAFAANAGRTQPPWAMPLTRVIGRALMRALDPQALQRAVCSQLDDFEDAWGTGPDFVDGHQHVHQLPQVREALLAELLRRYGPGGSAPLPWLRLTRARRGPQGVDLKQRVIESLGSGGFETQARRAGFRLNGALLGVYGFDADTTGYAKRLRSWLDQAHEGDVLMMHPARARTGQGAANDAIAHAREVEYTVLREQGTALLALAGACSGRMASKSSILRP